MGTWVILLILGAIAAALALVFLLPSWEKTENREESPIALAFVGEDSVFQNGFRQQFDFYHGYMHRTVQFRESRRYALQLDTQLTSGTIRVQVQNTHRKILLTLTPESPSAMLNVWAQREYHLTIQFIRAAGAYSLTWL